MLAFTIAIAVAFSRAHFPCRNRAIFPAKTWFAKTFTDLAKSMSTATFWANFFAECNDLACCATVARLAGTFAIDAQATITTLWCTRTRLSSFTKFSRKAWVTKASLIETQSPQVAILRALMRFATIISVITWIALAFTTNRAQSTIAAYSIVKVSVSFWAFRRNITRAVVALVVRVAKTFANMTITMHRAIFWAAFVCSSNFAGFSTVAHLTFAFTTNTYTTFTATLRALYRDGTSFAGESSITIATTVQTFTMSTASFWARNYYVTMFALVSRMAMTLAMAAITMIAAAFCATFKLDLASFTTESRETVAFASYAISISIACAFVSIVSRAANLDLAADASETGFAVAQRAGRRLGETTTIPVAFLVTLQLAALTSEALFTRT